MEVERSERVQNVPKMHAVRCTQEQISLKKIHLKTFPFVGTRPILKRSKGGEGILSVLTVQIGLEQIGITV